MRIEVPRDRERAFEPKLIGKHERRFTGIDDKIIAMYARGMTVPEIQAFLAEMHATEVAPDFVGTVTDAVLALHRRVSAPRMPRRKRDDGSAGLAVGQP